MVDEEEERVDRVEYTRIHRMMTKKEGELLHKEKELDRYLNPGFPVGRRCVRGAGRSDARRRRARQSEEEGGHQHDHAFMIDNGDLCT